MTDGNSDLERMRDENLDALSVEELRWSLRNMQKQEKVRLLRLVGLRFDPKFVKAGTESLVLVRVGQVKGNQRWELSDVLTEPCLREFERELGVSFGDPTEVQIRDALPRIEMRCGGPLARLTLVRAANGGAPASEHILKVLSDTVDLNGLDTSDHEVKIHEADTHQTVPDVEAPSIVLDDTSEVNSTSNREVVRPVVRMLDRVQQASFDSDATHYTSLLLVGEFITKLTTLSLIAGLDPEKDDAQTAYAKKYELLRADGIGSWSRVVQDLTTAPVFRLLDSEARGFHTSLTQRFGRESESWQRDAIDKLVEATSCFPSLSTDAGSGKASLAQWFQAFAALRNKTRGHGADLVSWQAKAGPPLLESILVITRNLECLAWPWWHIRRTAAGVPKVHPMTSSSFEFNADPFDLAAGTYVSIGPSCRQVELLTSTADVDDFFLPNGDAQDGKGRYEELSYISGAKRWGNLASFIRPPRELPLSETHGSVELRAVGNVLTNLPEPRQDYVSRQTLEEELQTVLTDVRHPLVAINGPGGIGKTSLALQVLHDLAESEAFSAVLWFSARDIDLDPVRGPLAVRPAGQSLSQFARQYWSYVEPAKLSEPDDILVAGFLDSLTESEIGPVVYVFDNFETVHNPPQLFREISEFARLPNKVLITTRHREFKGDWPLDVEGMSRDEFDSLVGITGANLNILPLLERSRAWMDSLYRESGGHPYVVKVALGEVARSQKAPQKFDRIMASRDEILDALFERSFNRLNPSAQRIFFTLCKWRARIPAIALEAVMTRPANTRMDVATALRHLEESSLIERAYSEVDAESFLHVPAAAYRFGIGQLQFSDLIQSVDEDAKFLHMFGAVSDNVTKTGFASHVHRFYDNASKLKDGDLSEAIAIGEYVARRYPESWMYLGNLQRATDGQGRVSAKTSYQAYLARRPDDADAWLELAKLCAELGDGVGELRAASQASMYAERRYSGLSESLRLVRERIESGRLRIDSRPKRDYLRALCQGWHPRENQTSVSDCYNLAKLAERGDDPTEVLFWVEQGLRRDRNNQRLRELRRIASTILSGRPR